MIKEIILKNWEAHNFFRTKLNPGINSFVGATDKGKSSIIRAIEWVVTNWYDGPADSFIKDESKPAFVGIRTEKGTVSRKKGKGINIYKVSGIKKPLEGFGTSVPDEVQQFLNMEKLNFQDQFDAPYWFKISPGQVSKELNRIVDLEIIDETLSKLNSKVRERKTEFNVSQKRLDDYDTEIGRLSFVKPMVKEYDKLSELEIEINEGRVYFDSLALGVKEVQIHITKAKNLIQANSDGKKLMQIGDKYKNMSDQMSSLRNNIKNLENDMDLAKAEIPNIKPLESIYNELKEAKQEYSIFSVHIAETILEKEKVCQKKEELELKEKRLKKMMGKTCPLCDRVLTK